MKKTVVWLLAAALLTAVWPACALPLTNEEALEVISSYLTEVYCYTAEEAARFTTEVEWEEEHWRIRFSPPEHPEWVYTATYTEGAPKIENVVTPFWHNEKPENYPGEGSVREGLNRARKNGWFVIWEDHMRQALSQYMKDFGINPTARLSEGLSLGNITAGDALHEYFVSCYGDEMNWTPELKQWHDAEMEYYGFTWQDSSLVQQANVSYVDTGYNGLQVEMTRFADEVPEGLKQVFAHPGLEGWACLCGATAQNVENRYGYGLAAFEKEGRRLLVGMKTDTESKEWLLSPISGQALYTDRDMYILYEDGMRQNQFTIVYQNSETETERFVVNVGNAGENRLDAYFYQYSRMDEASGNGIAYEIDSQVRVMSYENHQKVSEEMLARSFSTAMSMMDISAFPTTIEALKNASQQVIPEGYALVRGVHLRQKTSSRSKDLGDYQSGVLAKVLGTEPGDPWTWYHVQIGRAEGYMASAYVNEAVTQDTGYTLDRPLPIARAGGNVKLKSGTSWFSRTLQEIPEGMMMHVLAECDGGWLHVSVPQGEMGWQMDLNGMDGYVKENDVQISHTPLLLEWPEQ